MVRVLSLLLVAAVLALPTHPTALEPHLLGRPLALDLGEATAGGGKPAAPDLSLRPPARPAAGQAMSAAEFRQRLDAADATQRSGALLTAGGGVSLVGGFFLFFSGLSDAWGSSGRSGNTSMAIGSIALAAAPWLIGGGIIQLIRGNTARHEAEADWLRPQVVRQGAADP